MPMNARIEVIAPDNTGIVENHTFWRTHERGGNGGDRPVADFLGDTEGTATSGTVNDLTDTGASFAASYVGGYVVILDYQFSFGIRAIL